MILRIECRSRVRRIGLFRWGLGRMRGGGFARGGGIGGYLEFWGGGLIGLIGLWVGRGGFAGLGRGGLGVVGVVDFAGLRGWCCGGRGESLILRLGLGLMVGWK